MGETVCQSSNNGPLRIPGPLVLVDAEGKKSELSGETVFLCRCGGSGNKPFCDGTHKKNGFEGPAFALEEA